jgi:hypothetical protein
MITVINKSMAQLKRMITMITDLPQRRNNA